MAKLTAKSVTYMHPSKCCLKKLQAKQELLIDAYISVKEKYEIIKPALFSESVCASWGKGTARRGFEIIRYTITNDIIKDICNIAFDTSDKNVVSISSIYSKLQNPEIIVEAKQWCQTDEELLRESFNKQFDKKLEQFKSTWIKFQDKPYNATLVKIRNKIVAHIELQYDEERKTYSRLDVESEGLKWSDLEQSLHDIETMIEALSLIIIGKDFSFAALSTDLEMAANKFWEQRTLL